MKTFVKLSTVICLIVALACVFSGCGTVDLSKIQQKLAEREPDFVAVLLTDVTNNSALSPNLDSIFSSQVPDYSSRNITSALVGHDKYNLQRFVVVVVFEDKASAKDALEYVKTNHEKSSIAKLSGTTLFIASSDNLMKIIK